MNTYGELVLLALNDVSDELILDMDTAKAPIKSRPLAPYGVIAASIAMILITSTIWNISGTIGTDGAVSPSISGGLPSSPSFATIAPVDPNTVHINKVDGTPNSLSGFFVLSADWFIPMTKEELFEYYGCSFDVADVLDGFSLAADTDFGIYRFPGGEVLAHNSFTYVSADERATVTVGLTAEGLLPLAGLDVSDCQLERSKINDVEMELILYENEKSSQVYYTKFPYAGNGFLVSAENVKEEDFLRLISYLTSSHD